MEAGERYSLGTEVPQDYQKAFRMYSLACDRGDAPACEALGGQYERGNGTAQDVNKAAEILQRACDLRNESPCLRARRILARLKGEPEPDETDSTPSKTDLGPVQIPAEVEPTLPKLDGNTVEFEAKDYHNKYELRAADQTCTTPCRLQLQNKPQKLQISLGTTSWYKDIAFEGDSKVVLNYKPGHPVFSGWGPYLLVLGLGISALGWTDMFTDFTGYRSSVGTLMLVGGAAISYVGIYFIVDSFERTKMDVKLVKRAFGFHSLPVYASEAE